MRLNPSNALNTLCVFCEAWVKCLGLTVGLPILLVLSFLDIYRIEYTESWERRDNE